MDALEITTERVDDIPLLLGVMQRIGLVEILDHHIPSHWKQRELSWGWTSVIWLAYILTEGDHRKSSVADYIRGMQTTLQEVTGQQVSAADFTTDRLGHLLKYLSQAPFWRSIEHELNERSIEVYELPSAVVRCDATTVSGYHVGGEGSLFQFGRSKDDPRRRQIKLMTGALDPLGMPLATDVVSGERADDGLYLPVINRIDKALQKKGVLYCGDCKMSALATRAHLRGLGHHYLSPLPLTGKTAEEMPRWIEEGRDKRIQGTLQDVYRTNDKGQEILMAQGFEWEREQKGRDGNDELEWSERVLIIRSPTYAAQQEKGLEQRLEKARTKIRALTPARGRGKRQITEETVLKTQIETILTTYKVEGLLEVDYEKQVERQTKYKGRGRGATNRPKQVLETIRYQITAVNRLEDQIEQTKETLGWKALVTDATQEQLSLEQAVLCYRKEYRVERIFQRLKSRLNIAPLFVQRDDQVMGLTHLLTLGIRVLTLIEFVIRRALKRDQASLKGVFPGNPKRTTQTPTVERMLKAFSNVTLTIIHGRNQTIRYLTPLSDVQKDILERLGDEQRWYQNLVISIC